MTFWPDLAAGRSVTPGAVVGVGGMTMLPGVLPPAAAAAAGLVGSAGLGALDAAAGAEVGAGALDPPHAASTTPMAALPITPRKRRREETMALSPSHWLLAWSGIIRPGSTLEGEPEDAAAEVAQRLLGGGDVVRGALGGDLGAEVAQRLDRDGRVEVVVERVEEAALVGGRVERGAGRTRIAGGGLPQVARPGDRLGELVLEPVPALAVVVEREVEPHGVGRGALEHLARHDQVAERLGHLDAVEPDHAGVQPAAHEGRLAGEVLGLGDLAGVVGEDEVVAAAVDVDGVAEVVGGHGAALDVPAGAAGPPGAGPGGLAGLGGLPEDEVERVLLVGVVGVVAALVGGGERLVVAQAGELPELGVLADLVVDRAVLLVGVAAGDEAAGDLDDVVDLLGRQRVVVGRHPVELGHVVAEALGLLAAELVPGHADLLGLADDVVVDVGHVLDVGDVDALVAEVADEDVEGDVGEGVAGVGGVVGGDAADVDADVVVARDEGLLAHAVRVGELHLGDG